MNIHNICKAAEPKKELLVVCAALCRHCAALCRHIVILLIKHSKLFWSMFGGCYIRWYILLLKYRLRMMRIMMYRQGGNRR